MFALTIFIYISYVIGLLLFLLFINLWSPCDKLEVLLLIIAFAFSPIVITGFLVMVFIMLFLMVLEAKIYRL